MSFGLLPGFGATTFSLFRARVVLHDADQELFKRTVAKGIDAGLFPKKVLALIDSRPVLGAGAVKDTYGLLRSAIQAVKGARPRMVQRLQALGALAIKEVALAA